MAVTETVKIVFEVDDKQVTDSVTELAKLGKVSQEDAAKFKGLGDASKAAGASMSAAAKGAKELSTTTADIGKSAQGIGEITTSTKEVGEEFVSLRTRLRDAKNELAQIEEEFGVFSNEANAARERAGELADQMSDLNRQVNLLNPQGKAQAFVNFGQNLVGVFQVATGALQAFGAENEELSKAAEKLQGALNIVQGISSLKNLKESYEDIKTVLPFVAAAQANLSAAFTAGSLATGGATASLRAFAAALSATGIGAIVVALGALAGAFLLASDNAGEAATKSQALLDLEKEFIGLSDKRAAAELKIRVARGEITQDQADAILLQKELNALTGDQGKKLDEFRDKNKAIIGQYEIFVKAGREAEFFEAFDDDAADVIAQLKQLEKNKVEANKAADAEIIANQAETLAKQKEQAKEADKKRIEDVKKNAKEAEEARLKALQDNQANIDAINAANDSRRQQFEQELQSQLSDIDKAGQSERLQNQVIFFGDQQAISEENLVSEIRQQQQRIDKLKDFNQQDTQAYKDALAQKALLDKEYIKLKETNDQKALDEARAAALIQNQLLATSAEDLLDRNNLTQQKYLQDSIEIYKEGTKERKAAEDALALYLKGLREADVADAKKSEQEKAEAQKKRIDQSFEIATGFTDLLILENQRQNDEELALLEESRAKGLITEEQYEKKVKQLKIKAAQDQKNAQIFQATMSLAQSILNALTVQPATAVPAAVAFAATVGALNLAKVIATPLPKFKQGTLAVPGHDTGDDSVMAMLRPGEAVIPTETNREYAAVIRAIYTKKVSANELNEFVTSRDKRVSTQQLTEFMNSRNLTTFNEIYNSRNTTQTDRNEAKFYKYFDTERVIKSKQNTEVQLEPVFTFNPVTMEALFKRDLKVSNFNNTIVKRTGGDMPTIKVKADVDTQQLTRAMAKNKAVELSNSQVLAKALAQEIAKTHNPRRQ